MDLTALPGGDLAQEGLDDPARDRVADLLTDLEQEYGPIEPQVLEEVRQAWPGPGEEDLP